MPVAKGQANKRLLVGIVLDRSSSMSAIKAETIAGTNEQFSALRESDDAANTSVAFFSFNHEVTPVFKNDDGTPKLVPCSALEDISDGDYFPDGMTAMYDAVGDAIDFFTTEAKKVDDVLIVVISDGAENKSRRFTSEQISGQVKELQDSGWNFTYIGANQDLTQVASQLGFHEGNMLNFEANSAGTVQMSSTVGNAIRSYTSCRSKAIASGSTARLSTQNLYDMSGTAKNLNVNPDGHEVGDTVDLTVSGKEGTSVTVTADVEDDVKESQDGVA
jgi:hypothetical protein